MLLACGRLGLDDVIASIVEGLLANGIVPDRTVVRCCFIATAQSKDVLAAEVKVVFCPLLWGCGCGTCVFVSVRVCVWQ